MYTYNYVNNRYGMIVYAKRLGLHTWNDCLCKKTRVTYRHFCYTKVPPITTKFYTAHDNNYTDSTKSSLATLHIMFYA